MELEYAACQTVVSCKADGRGIALRLCLEFRAAGSFIMPRDFDGHLQLVTCDEFPSEIPHVRYAINRALSHIGFRSRTQLPGMTCRVCVFPPPNPSRQSPSPERPLPG